MIRNFFFIILALSAPYLHAAMVDTIQQPDGTITLSSPSELVVTVIKYAIGIAGIL
jgi:hypothetical protein